MESQCCVNCRYWVQMPSELWPGCHENPRMASYSASRRGKVLSSFSPQSPGVFVDGSGMYPDSWCGRWRERP